MGQLPKILLQLLLVQAKDSGGRFGKLPAVISLPSVGHHKADELINFPLPLLQRKAPALPIPLDLRPELLFQTVDNRKHIFLR